jgi:hypothetical protein
MQAMIQNDEDRRWMMPLLNFRNEYLKTEGDRGLREFTKMGGGLQLQFLSVKSGGRTAPSRPGKVVSEKVVRRLTSTSDGEEGYPMPNRKVLVLETRMVEVDGVKRETIYKIEKIATLVHGPYTQNYREAMLEALLRAQETIRNNLPESISEFSIITPEELEEIRRIWVIQKREFEDSVPDIFFRATEKAYPIPELDETTPFRPEDIRLLRDVCMDMAIDSSQSGLLDSKQLLFNVLRNQLGIQHSYRGAVRRVGLHAELEDMLETRSFDNEDQALDFALQRKAGGNELMYEMRDASDVFAYIPEEPPAQEFEA